eukprot:8801087-Pyramimonas_sp.AAC.1
MRYRSALPRNKSRMGEIYICGVLPAASFGSSVVGMSQGELQVAQRVLLSSRPPRHRGCSLQARP